ncbi:hypothetical protein EMIHUDRAFT_230766 [Emiliania huxleyi CCMP1516]|uniref:PPM-type phosphatase domain-containing protein n=2 Tax=Emiliania huxleyi TaxID=2903 RepID=A0A0D3K9L5_EMIH1|nr:hypothetical protein EMIHUDRAFT_230766 [Emiliania huxleyi CCMP1516]EOD32450.1 hypothetical protein EMIHUDRAFT_230766 [Emiliania huxleyi CCMP1516]|eukprot:XP_005784879.1 hypothetical protein EMIHUDRAFT_230766 [Emiliania huxleyi CCMP1516]
MLGVTTPPKAAERLPSPHTRPPLKGPLASKRELTVSIPADELECGSAATIHVAVAGRILKGEDKHAVLRATVGGERLLLCLVADGHGGNAASTHAAAYLLRSLRPRYVQCTLSHQWLFRAIYQLTVIAGLAIFVLLILARVKHRSARGIPGNPCCDCCCTRFCISHCCSGKEWAEEASPAAVNGAPGSTLV